MTTTPEPTPDATREQLASLAVHAANALQDERRHYGIACTELARERAAHEEHRRALSEALGLGTSGPWDAVLYCATKTHAAATERGAALHDARDALGTAGHGPAADDWPAIAPAIRALAAEMNEARAAQTRYEEETVGRFNAQAIRDRRRAEQAEAEVKRLGLMVDECSTGARQLSEKLRAAEERARKAERAANLLADSHRRAEQAEAAITRVRALCEGEWYGITGRAFLAALDGEQPDTQSDATLTLRCVCGDPIQLMDERDPTSWIHTPGSDTTCTNARPRCTCAGVGYGTGDCPAHHPPEPEQPAEPELIPVLDYAVRQVFAFARRIAKESRS